MDPKRKKIYMIVLGGCLVLLVGVLVWSQIGGGADVEAPLLTTQPINVPVATNRTQAPVIKTDGSYPVPSVFPQVKEFDSSVLTDLKLMKSFKALSLEDKELGRDNPLTGY
jgi:hypothetical protein